MRHLHYTTKHDCCIVPTRTECSKVALFLLLTFLIANFIITRISCVFLKLLKCCCRSLDDYKIVATMHFVTLGIRHIAIIILSQVVNEKVVNVNFGNRRKKI